MKINLDARILDLKNQEICDPKRVHPQTGDVLERHPPLTVGSVMTTALMMTHQKDEIDAKQKVRRFNLALKTESGGEQEFCVEDVAEIKRLIGLSFTPIVVGRIEQLVDPKTE